MEAFAVVLPAELSQKTIPGQWGMQERGIFVGFTTIDLYCDTWSITSLPSVMGTIWAKCVFFLREGINSDEIRI